MKKTAALDDLAALAGVPDRDLEFIRKRLSRAGLRLAPLEYFSSYHALWNSTPSNRDGTLLAARDDRRWRERVQPVKEAIARLFHTAISLRYDAILVPPAPVDTPAAPAPEEPLRALALHPDR